MTDPEEIEVECVRCALTFKALPGWQYCPMCGQQHYVEHDCDDPENCPDCNPASFAGGLAKEQEREE